MQDFHHTTGNTTDAVISYLVVAMGFLSELVADIDWMAFGAGLLLVMRLIMDVPKFIQYLIGIVKRDKHDSSK